MARRTRQGGVVKITDLREMLDNLNAPRMTTKPFQGGLARSGKHAAGHKGQAYKARQRRRSAS